MWISLQDKLVLIKKSTTILTQLHPKTVIEKVLLFGRPTDWSQFSDSLVGHRRLPYDPILKHNQNTLSIAFNGLLINSNAQIEYTYRLLPTDTIWSSPVTGSIVTFYQLASGNYRFEVRSHVKGFEWSKPAIFFFTIQKPFWEKWWFKFILILAASVIIFFMFRYRLNQLKEKANIQNEVHKMEMKALLAQMNPHFIHNALNSIQSLILNNRSNEASHYISRFAKLLRQVLESADKNITTLDKELYSLQLYVELERLRLNMDINYIELVDETIVASQIKLPPLILQPFVENALWHGLSNKKGGKKLIVSISIKDNWIICTITDNGIGRKKASALYSNFPEGHLAIATSIAEKRLKDYNASSDPSPLDFEDLFKEGDPCGTSVTIRIKIYI
jgi:two-component sensor histidine kinase